MLYFAENKSLKFLWIVGINFGCHVLPWIFDKVLLSAKYCYKRSHLLNSKVISVLIKKFLLFRKNYLNYIIKMPEDILNHMLWEEWPWNFKFNDEIKLMSCNKFILAAVMIFSSIHANVNAQKSWKRTCRRFDPSYGTGKM